MANKKVMMEEKKKKVCIMGFASSWKDTPFNDPDFELWTLNEAYNLLTPNKIPLDRVTRWFEVHNLNSPSKNTPEHRDFLRQCPIPLYVNEEYEDLPHATVYPRKEIKDYFNQNFIKDNGIGAAFTEFSNSISWMVALAIYEGFEEIWVTGVDMAQQDEYAWQRSSATGFIMFAAGKGIKVCIPQSSELCKFPHDYGFDTDNQIRIKKKTRKKELNIRRNQMKTEIQKRKAEIEQLQVQVIGLEGMISEIDYDLNNHIV